MTVRPVEAKVTAGSLAAGVSGVVLWVLQTWVFKGGVPGGVVSLVYLIVPAVLAAVAGWLAPHTNRPAPAPVAVPVSAPAAYVAEHAGPPPQP